MTDLERRISALEVGSMRLGPNPHGHSGWLLEHAEHDGPGVLVIGVDQAQAALVAEIVIPPGRHRVISMPTLDDYDARWQYERRLQRDEVSSS